MNLTAQQIRTIVAAYLGWTLDAFDFFVQTFVIRDIAKEFAVEVSAEAYALFLTLAMRFVGAFIFGRIGDHWGRKPALMLDILCYSIIGALAAFSPNLTVFLILRALFGVAMGGEWGLGSSLAMESIPPQSRGIVSDIQRVQAEPARVAQDGAFLLLGLPGGMPGQLGRQRAQLPHPGPVDQDVARRQHGDPFELPPGPPAGQAGCGQHGADLRHVERVGRVPGQLVALLDDPVVELHHLALERQVAHVVGGEPEPLARGEAAAVGGQRGRPQRLRHHRVPLVLGGDQLAEQPLAALHHELQILDGRDLVREQLRRWQIQLHRQCLPRLC